MFVPQSPHCKSQVAQVGQLVDGIEEGFEVRFATRPRTQATRSCFSLEIQIEAVRGGQDLLNAYLREGSWNLFRATCGLNLNISPLVYGSSRSALGSRQEARRHTSRKGKQLPTIRGPHAVTTPAPWNDADDANHRERAESPAGIARDYSDALFFSSLVYRYHSSRRARKSSLPQDERALWSRLRGYGTNGFCELAMRVMAPLQRV
ncbi:hypothetical protein KCU83_g54, partial [Aureobasidium melanogenum]